MKYLRTFAVVSLLFCVFVVGALVLWPTSTEAKNHTETNVSAGTTAGLVSVGNLPLTTAASGLQGGQVPGAGLKEVLDVSRLVLEASRDHSNNLARYIEHATTVIVVFFTLLGAVGATFGLHKLHDVDERAKAAIQKFEDDIKAARDSATTLESEFRLQIESANTDLRREINDQIELVVARVEIEQSIKSAAVDARMLRNASKRIQAVLDRKEVSNKARIRGLADLAFAKKRLGDHESAFFLVVEAANEAENNEAEMFPLLAYNAACYASLLSKPEALDWLRKAIHKVPHYKESALKDTDFACMKESASFKELLA